MERSLVTVETGIEIDTSDGYTAQADRVEMRTDLGRLVATGDVRATGPIGDIQANRLIIEPEEGSTRTDLGKETVLRFEDRVTLRYQQVPEGQE